ncbi:SAM-dependent methyltransferase [Prauserella marina]|uniref:Methylation protein EvaC n=1 Tax=Prauserella marina TaxID=530584 RepID=A0A222VLW1_9PSEU|nr:class I SAM-dependent methyltransferase [Prauserella marina]ASR34895.1 SAM-dependent methyltransferase [Prauserella marina]PWV85400.1 methylation protein EvaC [Prauserella marina]SDC55728.1 methylation protein EvaC [Prauserella marina]
MCRVCGGIVNEFFDFGRQPLSDTFLRPEEIEHEYFFRLAVGICEGCSMVQLVEEVPRDRMFHEDYPYQSSGSARMRAHFEQTARKFIETELTGADPFIVEIGCNDGVMLRTIGKAGIRHLGLEPSGGVAELARADGVRVRTDFFEESSATAIRASDGPADVIYAANTMCHIPYLDSIFRGVDALLAPNGVFVFEDPYLGDIVELNTFDQIYDEHFFLFSVNSVRTAAKRFGFDLVDVERLPVHGGEVRYTIARAGARPVSAAVESLAEEEHERGLTEQSTFDRFGTDVKRICGGLVDLLRKLRAEGKRVVGYGATAKSATVTNYCGIDSELVEVVYDSTPAKNGRLMPGSHIPVKRAAEFAEPYPDYVVLFAWNHAEEIMAKETAFREAGGRWIRYVPDVEIF